MTPPQLCQTLAERLGLRQSSGAFPRTHLRPSAFICGLLLALSLSVQTTRAELITSILTVTNPAVTGNRLYLATSTGSRLFTWTNQTSATLIQTNLTSAAATATNLMRALQSAPILGLFLSQSNATVINFKGSDLVLTNLGTWCSILRLTNSGTATYAPALPYDNLAPATRTNNATEQWYGLNKYSTDRVLSNVIVRAAALENVTVSNALYLGRLDFLAGLGLHGLSGIQTNYTITTNDLYVGVDTHTNTVTLTLPSAASSSNLFWWIKDEWGAAATNLLTIYPAAGNRIDGATNLVISNNFGSVAIRSRGGTNLSIVAGTVSAPPFPLSGAFDNILITNALGRVRSLQNSATTTVQIDVASGPQAYYWTNLTAALTLQFTNVWSASVTNRTLDFFFTGGASDRNVTFTCPNPSGVVFRWGLASLTNGATSFTVTNAMAVGACVTFWDTNLAEAYFSPVR